MRVDSLKLFGGLAKVLPLLPKQEQAGPRVVVPDVLDAGLGVSPDNLVRLGLFAPHSNYNGFTKAARNKRAGGPLQPLVIIMILKQVDLFRRFNSSLHVSSANGGVLTALGFIVAIALSYNLLASYNSPRLKTILDVSNDLELALPTSFDIYLLEISCPLVKVAWVNSLQLAARPVSTIDLKFERISKDGVPLSQPANKQEFAGKAVEAASNQEGCRLFGALNLPKTPGYLKFYASEDYAQELLDSNITKWDGVKYVLAELRFGEKVVEAQTYWHQNERVQSYFKSYSRKDEVVQDNSKDSQRTTVITHVNVVGEEVQDGGKRVKSYRYSLKSGHYSSEVSKSINFLVEMSPVSMVHVRQQKSSYHLVVELLGIIGGVFSCLSVVSALVQQLTGM